MTNSLFEFSKDYNWDGSHFSKIKGRPGKLLSDEDISNELFKEKISTIFSILEDIKQLKQIISNRNNLNISKPTKDYKTAVLESGIFNDFVKIDKSGISVVYERRNNRLYPLDSVGALSGWETFIFYLRNAQSPLIEQIAELTRPYVYDPKKNPEPSNESCLKYLLNKVELFEVITEEIPGNVKVYPAIVEGTGLTSLYTIPYTKQDVTIDSLNIYLKQILLNIQNHEYLCAIFWGVITGNDYPYVVYLKGSGGEGKSSFIDMLGQICGGSLAPFLNNNQFSIAAMANSAIIHVSENNNPHLLSDKLIKTLTGGNTVSIEGKGKTPYFDIIRGIIIADSNYHLKLQGEEYEIRRIRYHEILPLQINKEETLLKGQLVEKLLSSKNEFLNYCRQCFEKHSSKGKLIDNPPDHEETIYSLLDMKLKTSFDKFIKSLINDRDDPYEFRHSAECFESELLDPLENVIKGKWDIYTPRNFQNYMRIEHKVDLKGGRFRGFGKKPKATKNIGLSQED